MSDELHIRVGQAETRLDALEQDTRTRLQALRAELAELRELAAPREPEPIWAPDVWVAPQPAAEHEPEPAPAPEPARDLEPSSWTPSFDVAELLGARTLAWAGGLVTLLGVLFFFVLAVERGWIDAVARVAMGATASLLVFGAGVWLRRRYGDTYSSLAAVGAGIAGGYGTLLAAAALYDLLPAPAALAVAAGIAGVATVTAIVWASEFTAGLGLVAAICVPAVVTADGGLTTVGTAFAALVLAGALAVAVWQRWTALLLAATAASAPQVIALVAHSDASTAASLVLLAVFSALYLAAGLAEHEQRGTLEALPASYAMGAALLAGYGSAALLDGVDEGIALAVVAGVYLVLAALFHRSRRELSALVGAIGVAAGGVATAQVVSGTGLGVAWAAEAAVLAWLARRIDDERYQLAALAYLTLATGHVLAVDAPPRDLFTEVAHPAHGLLAVGALTLAGAVVAWRAYAWPAPADAKEGFWAPFSQSFADLRRAQPVVRVTGLALAGLAAVYAGSLAIVALVEPFDWAHVGVACLWGLVAVAIVAAAAAARREDVGVAGIVWTAALLPLAVFDVVSLEETPAHWAWLALGVGVGLATGIWQVRLSIRRVDPVAFTGAVVAALLTLTAVAQQFGPGWLLAPAAVWLAVAAALRLRERDYATLALGIGLVQLAIALVHFLTGTWLVLAVTAAAILLALLARRLAEPRLAIASAAYLLLALAQALGVDAPPRDLFVARPHPASGTQSVAIAAVGIAVLAWTLAGRLRRWAAALAAALPVYAASLAILELSIAVGDRPLDAAFQRGHVGVSALWGLVGLALLTAGAARHHAALRIGGFALFGIALAKLFLFDLAFLSSITRAFSFLAVGAVLLAGGFLYQRLTRLDSADAR